MGTLAEQHLPCNSTSVSSCLACHRHWELLPIFQQEQAFATIGQPKSGPQKRPQSPSRCPQILVTVGPEL